MTLLTTLPTTVQSVHDHGLVVLPGEGGGHRGTDRVPLRPEGTMQQRYRQSTSVILSLVGVQDTSVVAHRALTDGATVGVRMGQALFYLHDRATAAQFASTFDKLSTMSGLLAREVDAQHVAPVPGVRDAAVVIDARNRPRIHGRLEHLDARRVFLRVSVGRVVLDMWDLGAYASARQG
jgi:hypothetical protein